MKQHATQRIYADLEKMLRATRILERSDRRRDMERDDRGDPGDRNRHRQPMRMRFAPKDDVCHPASESVRDDHGHVADREHEEREEAEQMQTPGGLSASDDAKKSRKPTRKCRRHHQPGENLQRCEREDEQEVRDLLERIVWMARCGEP